MKQSQLLALLVLAGFISFAIAFNSTKSRNIDVADQSGGVGMHASWASQALTPEELYEEADLIVRVRVLEQEGRVLEEMLPAYEVEGDLLETVKAETEPRLVGEIKSATPFTDSILEVLEVYKGNADDTITVTQLGGYYTPQGDASRSSKRQLVDDPLYSVGTEMVLFLIDISDDEVHASNRTLFATVNPAGRYDIRGTKVYSQAEPVFIDARQVELPSTLEELQDKLEELHR